jgi:ribonuclease P protein component
MAVGLAPRIEAAPPPAGRFGRGDRLQHQSDFRRAMKKGRKYQGPHVLLVALRGATDHSRLGLAIAKTVGHSPARARLRRLLREAFRGLRSQLKTPTDLVVLARVAWPGANLAVVSEELWQAAVQMRLVG